MFDASEDFIVFDGTESMTLDKVRPENGDPIIDFTSGTVSDGRAQHEDNIVLENCLLRLVSDRDQALVKQIFQRGVALASLDFHVADVVVEIYDPASIDLEDILITNDGDQYQVIAFDSSHMTRRIRAACRAIR